MRIEYKGLAVSAVTISTSAMTISKIFGFKVAGTDRFLQLHNTKATPAAAAVPLKVWNCYGTAPFGEGFIDDEISCSVGCTFVVSTTANTYTAVAETVDLFVNGEQVWDNTGVSSIGDYTNGVSGLDGWGFDAVPIRRLERIEFTALTDAGVILYAKIFPQILTDLTTGDLPVLQLSLARNTSLDSFFYTVITQTEGALTLNGLSVVIDSEPGPLSDAYSGTDFAIKISYK